MKTNPNDPAKPKYLKPQTQHGKTSPTAEGNSRVDQGVLNDGQGANAARKSR
jgi:hypothetical protein